MSSSDFKTQLIKSHITNLITRLENWVREQKRFVSELERYGEHIDRSQDRLSLLLSAQAMLHYIERVLKDFESWISNPLITSIMSVDILKDLERKLREIAIEFVKLDLEHTLKYTEMLKNIEHDESQLELLKIYFEHRGVAYNREQSERREIPRIL